EKQPNKTAIIYQGQCISYREFYHRVCQLRQGIQILTRNRTPKVAILLGNEPDFLALFFAVISLGGIAVPFDPKWSDRDATHAMEEADPDIVITNKSFVEMTRYHFQAIDIEAVRAVEGDVPSNGQKPHANDAFYLGFTSGSTGRPKGFLRNHGSWLSSFLSAEQAF